MKTNVDWRKRMATTKERTFVDVRVYYSKGDDYAGGKARGYYATFDVVEELPPQKDRYTGLPYIVTNLIPAAGLSVFLASCNKKSAQVSANAVDLLNKNMSVYLDRVCSKSGIQMKAG